MYVDVVRFDARRDDLIEGDFFFDVVEVLIVVYVVFFDVISEVIVECIDGVCVLVIMRIFNFFYRILDEFIRV